MSRPFDLVIYGATGYTAQLAVDYLISAPSLVGKTYKWAIAGRSQEKLAAVLAARKAALDAAGMATPAVLVASVDDPASLDALCQQTTVLLAMAGPYALCGLPVVAACVRNGTHYMDITGEFQFIRWAIKAHHAEAEQKKVAIITTCGFDCVPSDMGALMMHEFAAKNDNNTNTNGENGKASESTSTSSGDAVKEVAAYFTLSGAGEASGGTAHSIANLFKTMTAEDVSSLCLVPSHLRSVVPTPMQLFVGYTRDACSTYSMNTLARRGGAYTCPFIMAGGNERTVRRSNALLGRPQSAYWEAATAKNIVEALAMCVAVGVLGAVMMIPPLRWLATRFVLPPQGKGPTAAAKKDNGYVATFIATTEKGRRFKGTFADNRNPYDSTAVFIVEAAATLLEMLKEGSGPLVGGVIPPAVALGPKYLDRLRQVGGITTELTEITKSK